MHGAAGESLAPELGDGVVAGDLPRAIAAVMVRLAALARLQAEPVGVPGARRGS